MANPRELAEQAFALLQNALRDSEARASDLDEQLKRKRSPKNRVEEQLDVLTHRLEKVEAERARWEQQAGHLEEVAEAERTKVAQLKKKLEIAESGPEKLTKKEINFWRAKVEGFDTETKDYKERLAHLLRELMDRDALIEQLRAAPALSKPDSAPAAQSDAAASAELRRQLEQRDQWLAELRLELHELRSQQAGNTEAPLETQAEMETLRHQIASFDRALADAHNARAAVQAELTRTQQELAERERTMRESESANERHRATLAEREHRIVELSAEAEHLRNDLRQREEQSRNFELQRNEQNATLQHELEAARGIIEQHKQASASEIERLQTAVAIAEQRATDVAAEVARLEALLTERDQNIANHEQRLAERDRALEQREREIAERDQLLEEQRARHAERDSAYEAQQQQLARRDNDLAERANQLRELGDRLAEREHAFATANNELEHIKATEAANSRELASLRDTLQGTSRELDQLRQQKQRLENDIAELLTRTDSAESEAAAAKEQIAGLEAELKEEKEHAENLGELANERREHMTKLQEQLEEAEERYADANWRLGKAQYFERLVKRRKGLIAKLLAALRAKMKANTALKAGLDGLRTYKASAEMNQQKLLQRIEQLKTELREAEETVERHQGATHTKQDLAEAESRTAALEERLNTQAELIQSLEADLKTARMAQKTGDEKNQEIERLEKELETKNQVIAQLQADTDEQQRKLSKLRGSESETVRLRALTEKDRSEIDALQREVAQLREALLRQSQGSEGSSDEEGKNDLEARLREREASVTRLMGTVKEHENTIKKLNESAESWKRKYEFLATEEPAPYKASAEK